MVRQALVLLAVGCVDEVAPRTFACGPGTVETPEGCAIEAAALEGCAPGEVRREDTCVALAPSTLRLPFVAGHTVKVSQGHHGALSHHGASVYAVDFPVPVDTPVVAARGGRVLEVRSDSDAGCGEPSCAADANFVVVDHGDATFAMYWHLAFEGVDVAVGDTVAAGQLLGWSGNTGFSTGPHLHFQVRDPFGQSVPLVFDDVPGGTVYAGGRFTSDNVEEPLPAAEPDWSTCPTDLFAWLGVTLDPGVPCARVSADEVTTVSGRVEVDGGTALVATLADGALTPDTTCVEGGGFQAEVDWAGLGYDGDALLAVAAADEACRPFQGWDVGVRLVIAD